MSPQLLFLELNEINLENVAFYCRDGRLPHFARLIEQSGWAVTTSERTYDELEPWIQWVTAHTGCTLAEHQVFRLGDIVQKDIPQIWEILEERGLRTGAMSPMNAKHRVGNPAFFVPDPWTRTGITAPPRLRALHSAIVQAVNDNAQSRITLASVAALLVGFFAYALPQNYARYGRLIATSRNRHWRRAIFLDMLLADAFVREIERTGPDFATLFVNAGAHIQHHYLFSAACYAGPQRNPTWYLPHGEDPVFEVYSAYDRIVGTIRSRFPAARMMMATGLHQDPHDRVTFYWRLRHHENFLRRLRVPFKRVEPRMSRDFVIVCENERQASAACSRLSRATAADGEPLFEIDNRGKDLFVMLTYPGEIGEGFTLRVGDEVFANFEDDVAFVALKNGQHNGTGYFLDTGRRVATGSETFPLTAMPARIMDALGVAVPRVVSRAAAG